ncbi:unnamed protein product, partial [Polarella glacialis]
MSLSTSPSLAHLRLNGAARPASQGSNGGRLSPHCLRSGISASEAPDTNDPWRRGAWDCQEWSMLPTTGSFPNYTRQTKSRARFESGGSQGDFEVTSRATGLCNSPELSVTLPSPSAALRPVVGVRSERALLPIDVPASNGGIRRPSSTTSEYRPVGLASISPVASPISIRKLKRFHTSPTSGGSFPFDTSEVPLLGRALGQGAPEGRERQ